ncbi:hypothetical protein LTR53_003409 [Teratosphaeriaceae sp. CCFEE 6253]|nr:hypothetical protein LTR53_003409 [Teratosphaeriaceae sp. CCFEE 6253]
MTAPPDEPQVVRAHGRDDYRDEPPDDEPEIDLGIGEEAGPAVAMARLHLPGRLGASDGTHGMLAANADAEQEAMRDQRCGETGMRPARAPRSCTESGEDGEDDRGDEQTPFPRVVIAGVAEDQLAEDRAREGDGGHILRGRARGPSLKKPAPQARAGQVRPQRDFEIASSGASRSRSGNDWTSPSSLLCSLSMLSGYF